MAVAASRKDENEVLECMGACDKEREVRVDSRSILWKAVRASLDYCECAGRSEVFTLVPCRGGVEATASECDKQELEAGETTTTLPHKSYVPRLKQLSPTAFRLSTIVTTKKRKKKKEKRRRIETRMTTSFVILTFIMTNQNVRIFGVSPFFKLENNA